MSTTEISTRGIATVRWEFSLCWLTHAAGHDFQLLALLQICGIYHRQKAAHRMHCSRASTFCICICICIVHESRQCLPHAGHPFAAAQVVRAAGPRCMSRPVRLRLLRQWDDGLRGRPVRRRRSRLLRVAVWVVQRRLWAVVADRVRAGLVSRRARGVRARVRLLVPPPRRYSVGYGNVGCQSCAPGSYTYWDG
jgi:hypothetical protein